MGVLFIIKAKQRPNSSLPIAYKLSKTQSITIILWALNYCYRITNCVSEK